jgi:serine protease Do
MDVETITPEVAKETGVPEKTTGVIVNEIRYGSPADKAGIMRGDIIVEVDRKAIRSEADFYRTIRAKRSYLLRVMREDESGQDRFEVIVLDLK